MNRLQNRVIKDERCKVAGKIVIPTTAGAGIFNTKPPIETMTPGETWQNLCKTEHAEAATSDRNLLKKDPIYTGRFRFWYKSPRLIRNSE